MRKKRLLITGATGFLGSRTTEKLVLEEDIEFIMAAGRVLKPGTKVESSKVSYLLGDLRNADYVQSLFQNKITHVIHCAALSSPWGKYQEFYDANVLVTHNLLKESKKNGIERFIYISSPSVYFNHRHRLNVKEDDPLPLKFVNYYASTKREAEILLENSGINFISLRPRAIIGRGDTVIMPRIIRAVKEGKLRIIGNGKNMVDLTSVENVIEAIHLSLNKKGQVLNQHFNITNGNPVKLWEVINSTLNQLNMRPPEKKISLPAAKAIAFFIEFFARVAQNKEPVLTRYSVGVSALNFTLDISKAKTLLGYQAKVTTEETINDFVKWHKVNNHGTD